ncbi:MAG: oligopeptidase B, partial [Planctomycetes bacterium]|nr:oligopeptidase B [Planctomycetota bacterium]
MLSEKRFIAYLQYAALLSFILCLAGCIGRQYIAPPAAKVIAKADTLHGDTRIDNYYWLREKSNPEVIKYLEAENKYTKAMMKNTEKFQEQL